MKSSINQALGRREFLKRATQAAAIISVPAGMAPGAMPLIARAAEERPPAGPRASYCVDGQIHVNELGKPEGSEKKVCFEFLTGFNFTEPGHTLYIADFDAQRRAITNLKAIANEQGKPFWFAYPRWIEGEAAVVYHANRTGKGQLFVYRLADGSTRRVSTNPGADYRYPHGEAAPC